MPSRSVLDRLLQQRERELFVRKDFLRREIPSEAAEVRDIVDVSADHSARGVGASLVEFAARQVQGIEDALRRVAAGDYGRCEDCGHRIPPARLNAVPFAERCRGCQEAHDAAAA